MQKHIQHNKDDWRHFFRKIYLSLYWKGCVWEGVGDRTELQHIDPQLFWLSQPFFSVLLGCSTGGLGPSSLLRAGSHSSNWNTDFKLWTPTDLNFLSSGLYHCFTPTQFNPTTVKTIPDLLISSTGCTCYLHRCIFSFDSLAGSEVNMQHNHF